MQENIGDLEKQAIKAAIAGNWALARDFNLSILALQPDNLEAKNRLGKAYLQMKDFKKARKFFKEVLEQDPINSTALKNFALAKEERAVAPSSTPFFNIVKEPATVVEAAATLTAKRITAAHFSKGTPLSVKVAGRSVKLFLDEDNEKVEVGEIVDQQVLAKIRSGHEAGANFWVNFLKGDGKDIVVVVNSSQPVFSSERQEYKPYTKKDYSDTEVETDREYDTSN